MAQIIRFPASSSYKTLSVPRDDKHVVSVRIADRRRPKEARWHMQWPMLRAAGGRCLKGFNNTAAKQGDWHDFKVRDELLRRFLLDIEILVGQGRVLVEVDGTMVRTAKRA